ncbi:CheY-like chemotaxis protein [Sphingomonas zeicaulis]|uniref:response regulator n=1 Tax=Sphingomonas zeicaulis TaxID=1632740 RepID=UPI003D259429
MNSNILAGRRILVVEDDYYLARELVELLERVGATIVGPFATVGDALSSLERAPDAAILDLCLVDETSLPVAHRLEERGTPFIFAIGAPNELPASHGAHSVLLKPANDASILRALREALA